MVVTVGRTSLGYYTSQRCGTVSPGVASFTCTLSSRTFRNTDTVLGAPMNGLTACFVSSFDDIFFVRCSYVGDTQTFSAVLSLPTRNTMTGTIHTDTVLFTLSRTLHSLLAGRPGESRGAEAFTTQTLTTRWFDHLTVDGDIRGLARVRASRVNLYSTA